MCCVVVDGPSLPWVRCRLLYRIIQIAQLSLLLLKALNVVILLAVVVYVVRCQLERLYVMPRSPS